MEQYYQTYKEDLKNQIIQQQKIIEQAQQDKRANTAHLRQGPQHALMSYGPFNIIRERVIRNFDHLEILKEIQRLQKQKVKDQKQQAALRRYQNMIAVSGQKLDIPQVDKKNLQDARNKIDQIPLMPNYKVCSTNNLQTLFCNKLLSSQDNTRSQSQLQLRVEKPKLKKGLILANSTNNLHLQNVFIEDEARKNVYNKLKQQNVVLVSPNEGQVVLQTATVQSMKQQLHPADGAARSQDIQTDIKNLSSEQQ